MLFRSVVEAELDQVAELFEADPASWVDAAQFRTELAAGQYRPEWVWLAEDAGVPVALAVWWSRAGEPVPLALDHLWVAASVGDRVGAAAELLAAAHRMLGARPDFELRLPVGWRHRPAAVAALEWRRQAAARAGLTEELERLQYAWTPASGLPTAGERLLFRPEPDDAAFLDVFRRVAVGSLDTTSRRNVAALGAERAAGKELAIYASVPDTRGWWRLAYTRDGTLVGFGIPWRNPYGRNVGYLGVLPEQRGNGYIGEVLADITRFHAAAGAERITATTDMVNVPMQRAFERAGYRNTEVRFVLSAPVATA
ncbi:N-acetyltransferase [Actinocatenispora thailandica]|uniref:N-acetyltransferase n=1 Tax=Actinocatenispora thailandica TaxID=227318 RepID=A0A7R7DRN7_9ACTN|nr:GNAT family N-acetyltransferase [Actinocatenispora thailandica]BCJ36598.1 N-acetyltransferase [Actinocatenispora thailandica]